VAVFAKMNVKKAAFIRIVIIAIFLGLRGLVEILALLGLR